jgi:hypothetical protein
MSHYRLKGASGPVINQAFRLSTRSVIGSAQECDLRVETGGVASRHAEIRESVSGALVLSNLDPAFETLLNGEPVDQIGLASGDEIRIANCRWVLQAPGLRPEKVLTSDAVKPARSYIPWLITALLLSAAGLAWSRGWLPF